MATMRGTVLPSAPAGNARPDPSSALFSECLVVSNPPKAKRRYLLPLSVAGHLIVITLLVVVPILWPEESPAHPDYIYLISYNPPPPPPPPLKKGSETAPKTEKAQPTTPDPKPQKVPEFTAPVQPKEEPLQPEAKLPETEQLGSEKGSELGSDEGMEVGVEGGVVGGTPGGVIGGVIGGTGDIPVLDYDQPPRLLRQPRLVYPQDAFIKKIEGVVEVEILIDVSGHVSRARVVRSVPMLDAAAIDNVKQWLFAPAMKGGRPVPTTAVAPVTFRIY